MSLAEDQFIETNNHVRHVAQLVLTWYAFFVTGNIVAIGWITKADTNGTISIPYEVTWSIIAVFVFVNLLGILGLIADKKYLIDEDTRIKEMIDTLDTNIETCFKKSPVPLQLYSRSISLMIASLIALIVLWISVAIV